MKGQSFIGALRTRCVQYASDYSLVLSHPKRFNDYRAANISGSIPRASYFLAVSLALAIVLSPLLLPPEAFQWKFAAAYVVLDLLAFVVSALALRASWFFVGGRAPLKNLYLIFAYHYGVLVVWSTFVVWVFDIVVRIFDPGIYSALYNPDGTAGANSEMGSPVYLAALLIMYAGFLGMFAWLIVGWGAYRKLNGLSRRRSIFAFLIANALAVVMGIVISTLETAILLPE